MLLAVRAFRMLPDWVDDLGESSPLETPFVSAAWNSTSFQKLWLRFSSIPHERSSQPCGLLAVSFTFRLLPASPCLQARGSDLRTHFKNTREAAMAIRNMNLEKAKTYLQAVIDHKRCVPFLRFNGA